ncbi:cell adhesion molecule Dscam1-like [Ornithodoros turicata]|uniref:cell adhesion molecule Dscam1-like n=1 Tax=Ornithodoros turicata TaxID=34597 RepID=UPI003139D57C
MSQCAQVCAMPVSLLLFVGYFVINPGASLSVEGPRFVREPPARVHFHNSTGVVIPCTARGHPNPDVRWISLDDGRQVTDVHGLRLVQSDGALVFQPFRADQYRQDVHTASYRCLASNRVGTIGSRDVHVMAVVHHSYQPVVYDEFVISGNTAVLRCSVPSFAKEHLKFVSWQRDDGLVITPNLDRTKYSVLPSGELYIRNAGSTDRLRAYQCKTKHKLTNEVVSSTTPGRLTVQAPQGAASPKITDSRPFVQAEEGQDVVELACAAQGHPPPTYRWYREIEGHLVDLSADPRAVQAQGSIFLARPRVNDSGRYFCLVNNSVGEEQVRTILSVTAPLEANLLPPIQTVDVGQSVAFNCSAKGHPIRSVIWYKNQHPLEPSTRVSVLPPGLLRIASVQRDDTGMYQCYLNNEADSAEAAAELRLGDIAPHFLWTFTEQTSDPGAHASLRCAAAGSPLPQVTWTLDGGPVPEFLRFRVGDFVTADGVVVSFVNVTELRVEDGGEYACMASNAVSDIVHRTRLNVRGPPVIRRMSNVSVIAGTTLKVTCPVAGFPIHSISWMKGDSLLPINHRQQISHGTLSVHNVQRASDEGQYSCIARSKNLTAKGSTFIDVQVPPAIDTQMLPEVLTSSEGMNVKMLCSVVEGDPPISLRWTRNGHVVTRSSSVSLQSLEDSSVLTLKKVSARDNGTYTCEASNRALTVNRTVNLIVNVPPRWTREPSNSAVIRGDRVAIHCVADGYPMPRIEWKRAQGTEPRNFHVMTGSYRIHVHTNGTLLVHDAEIRDAGYYLCQAHNGIGVGLSKVITLFVNVPPSFATKFASQNVKKEQEAILKCEATGDPDLVISWEKDKQALDLTLEKRYTLTEEPSEGKLSSTLTITAAERQDGALYTCTVRNPYGSDETNIQLLVQEPPSPPADLQAVKVSSRTAELTWSPSYNGNSPVKKYHVYYVNTTSSWDSTGRSAPHISVLGTENRATLHKLSPMMKYKVRIIAENALGHSAPSDIVEVATSEEAPGGPPLHVKVEATGSQSLKVSWEPPRNDLHHGKIQGYYIGYKEVNKGNVEYQYKNVEALDGDPTSRRRHMSHLTNLKRKATYTVKVQAYNSEGAGPMSDDISATTLEAVPPTSPELMFKSSTASSVTVEWERYQEDVAVKDYLLHYQVEGGEWQQKSVRTDSNKYTLDGLKCGSLYSLYMTVSNSLGTAEPRDVIYARTKGAAPVSSKQEELVVLNATSVTLNLDTWHSGGCPIHYFGVQVRPAFQKQWKSISERIPAQQRRLELRHLSPGKEYDLRVSAYSDAGTTEADFTFRTLNRSHVASMSSNHGTSQVQQNGDDTPLYRNLSVLLPVAVSIIVLVVVIASVIVCLRRQNDNYGTTGQVDDNHTEEQLRKCSGSIDSVGLSEFCKKQETYVKSPPSYYASPARKPVPIASASKRGRRDEGHEYAEPYAARQIQQRLMDDVECTGMPLSYHSRCEGGNCTTLKRSPPRHSTHAAGFCQEVS